MAHSYIAKDVNIDQFPVIDPENFINENAHITVGDLHGSAIKLLYILSFHGFITISEENYERFAKLYYKTKLVKNDLNLFEEILSAIKINDVAKTSLLRLIGDILADRGKNDYYTLRILKMLRDNNVPVEILISNHDAEFINLLEKNKDFNLSTLGDSANSARGLHQLVKDKLITRDEIKALAESCYKPNLKALSYTLDESNQITIYSHGVIGLENIKYIAAALKLPFLGEEPHLLANTIDAINLEVNKHIQNNTLSALINLESVDIDAINDLHPIDPVKFPFVHLIWNRRTEGLSRPSHIKFVHGHDMRDKTALNIFNLDNTLAKIPFGQWSKGIYNYLYSVGEKTLMLDKTMNSSTEISAEEFAAQFSSSASVNTSKASMLSFLWTNKSLAKAESDAAQKNKSGGLKI